MKSGTKGIVAYKGKILLILRDDKPDIPYPNTWEYIGGGKDESESFEEAGLREVEEEIGVRPSNYTYLGADEYHGRKAGRFIAILTDKEFDNIKLGSEGQKYDFFTLDETIKLDMAPSLVKFLTENMDVLKQAIEGNEVIDTSKFIFTKQP